MSELGVATLIVGGGPAGLAPLLAAGRLGLLDRLLADGVAVVEGGAELGRGSIGDYAIGSDSSAQTFASALAGPTDPRLAALAEHPFARGLAALGADPVPLAQVGRFQALDRADTGGDAARPAGVPRADRVMPPCMPSGSRMAGA